jgi:hypothetical protein
LKLKDVVDKLYVPLGLTSIISGIMGGDFESIRGGSKELNFSLSQARKKRDAIKKGMDNAKSDASYWGWWSQHCYWVCMCDLLEAAKITGINDLPDVPLTDIKNKVVMDAGAVLEEFGKKVLAKAQAL